MIELGKEGFGKYVVVFSYMDYFSVVLKNVDIKGRVKYVVEKMRSI